MNTGHINSQNVEKFPFRIPLDARECHYRRSNTLDKSTSFPILHMSEEGRAMVSTLVSSGESLSEERTNDTSNHHYPSSEIIMNNDPR